MNRFTKIAGSALLITTCLSSASLAQTKDELQAEISSLKDRLNALEQMVGKTADTKDAGSKAVVFSSSDPAPTLTSVDKKHSFNIRGRAMIDWSTGSDENNTFDFSGTKLRAAWLGVEGMAADNIKYKFEADFGGNSVSVKDAYLQFKASDWSLTVGQSKVPNSLEALTAISQTSLMERGAFKSAFDFGRAMGVKAATNGKGWSLTAGIFQGTNKFSSNTEEGWIAAARATYGQKSDSGTWLVGVSGRLRDMNDDNISYKAKAITNLSGTLTSASGTSKDNMVAAEAAFSYGSFFGAVEYAFLSATDAVAVGENAGFSGGYAEVGYVLTGESRPINLKNGTWGRPKVDDPFGKSGGSGLWMLTARYDTLDLTDSGIYGGKQESYIVSLSWYMTRYIRAMLDYGHSEVSDLAANGTNSADVVGLRLNVDW
ncbi:OprO/OprP family phosphate-selective porin [Emcibacter sp.]|uniref:OprO/OprP family phosphate-selective porin n=1 Tax=Emcibacter sp. TaxID=1979954 RepID=UPI003A905DC0